MLTVILPWAAVVLLILIVVWVASGPQGGPR